MTQTTKRRIPELLFPGILRFFFITGILISHSLIVRIFSGSLKIRFQSFLQKFSVNTFSTFYPVGDLTDLLYTFLSYM